MLTVSVTLLHGAIRAASADDLILTGAEDPGDWPPSPARIFAALVAGDGTRNRCRVSTGAELRPLEGAHPPRIYASPRSDVLSSHQKLRYVVVNERIENTVQEYPARTSAENRPGTRLYPRDRRVVYVWDDIAPTVGEMKALRARAARVGYLGCADSPAHLSVSATFDPSLAPVTVWMPEARGDADIPVPTRGLLDTLDHIYDEWTTGKHVRRSWYPPARQRYRSPDQPVITVVPAPWPHIVWLKFESPLPGVTALRVAETLKRAVLDLYQRHVGDVPSVLHGHGFEGARDYQVAQWLALPDVGHPHSTGRIHGAAVMLPAGSEADVVEGVKEALWRRWQMVIPGEAPVAVRPHAGEQRPWTTNPSRWRGPARTWVSALPTVHERRRRGGVSADDVAQWCRHAGFPEPVAIRLSPVPIVAGGPLLRPEHVFRQRDGVRRPYSYLELRFEREVLGPVVLGRARQFGLGLLAPQLPQRDGGG